MSKINFKTLLLFFMIFPLYLYAQDIYEAKHYKIDTIITGKVYKVIIHSGWETEGKITSQDSATIKIRSKLQEYTVFKDQIIAIGSLSDELFTVEGHNVPSYNCKVYLAGKKVIGGVQLTDINDDTLFCKSKTGSHKLPVENIRKIKYVNDSHLWVGAVVGAVLGGAIGYLAGPDLSPPEGQIYILNWWSDINWKPFTAITGAISGALIGIGLSAVTGMNDEYDISKMNTLTKRDEIKRIIIENR